MREFVSRALESDGHAVSAVADGGQAVAKLGGQQFDLLLADIRMPVMDGVALALKVTTDHPDMPILLMTGFADEMRRAHNLDRLVDDVISKPFSLQQICKAVNRALDRAPVAN